MIWPACLKKSPAVTSRTGYFFGSLWTLCYKEQLYAVAGACLFLVPQHFTKLIATITLIVAVMFPGDLTNSSSSDCGCSLLLASDVYQALNYGTGRSVIALVALLTAAAMHQYFQRPHPEIDHIFLTSRTLVPFCLRSY
jgi:peptidoglycan/LPS O-acetylase OafA/YrhL